MCPRNTSNTLQFTMQCSHQQPGVHSIEKLVIYIINHRILDHMKNCSINTKCKQIFHKSVFETFSEY